MGPNTNRKYQTQIASNFVGESRHKYKMGCSEVATLLIGVVWA